VVLLMWMGSIGLHVVYEITWILKGGWSRTSLEFWLMQKSQLLVNGDFSVILSSEDKKGRLSLKLKGC